MSSQLVSTRLRYLNDSAHLLAASSPSTSAFLMSRYNNLMFDSDLERTDTQSLQACGACGNIMILGVTATRQVERHRVKKRRKSPLSKIDAPDGAQEQRVVLYDCGLCGRQTRQRFHNPTAEASRSGPSRSRGVLPVATQKSSSPSNPSSELMPSTVHTGSAAANASSKKRAKGRKQGSLQALLARKNETAKGGFGLDLLDLMKKS